LKPDESAAVLRRLLEAHPDLVGEAEEKARSLLHQVNYEDVAAEIEDEIRALDYDDLNARAGRHEWGYVEPSEATWEILEETVEPFREDMKRHLELGLKGEALEICKGLCWAVIGSANVRVATFWDGRPTSRQRPLATLWRFGILDPTTPRDARRDGNGILRLRRSFSIWFPSGYP
jgi:hypothetical protein